MNANAGYATGSSPVQASTYGQGIIASLSLFYRNGLQKRLLCEHTPAGKVCQMVEWVHAKRYSGCEETGRDDQPRHR